MIHPRGAVHSVAELIFYYIRYFASLTGLRRWTRSAGSSRKSEPLAELPHQSEVKRGKSSKDVIVVDARWIPSHVNLYLARCGIRQETRYHVPVKLPLDFVENKGQEFQISPAEIATRNVRLAGVEVEILSPQVPAAEVIVVGRSDHGRVTSISSSVDHQVAHPGENVTFLAELSLTLPPVELLSRTVSELHVPESSEAIHKGIKASYQRGTHQAGLTPNQWLELWQLFQVPLRVDDLLNKELPGTLYPYQVEGVKNLIVKERFLLADEMGTGKTVQVCAALMLLGRLRRIRRALVVCPKTALSVWTSHVKKWVPGASYWVYSGELVAPSAHDGSVNIQIVSYSQLSNDRSVWRLTGNWDVVVFDEVHHLRNVETRRYRVAEKLVRTARYRWGLSGTPLQNRIDDLSAIVSLIRPEVRIDPQLMTPQQVRDRIRPIIRRVRRKDVLPDLPEKHRRPIWLTMTSTQRQEYNRELGIVQNIFRKSRQGVVGWQLLSRLQQICNFPSSSASPKCEKTKELVREIVGKNEKVVIFTRFLEYGLYRLEKELSSFGLASIYGQSSDWERKRQIERFQTDPTCHVFLSTIQTGGVAITLTAANHVIHFDHWWNPAVAWQAEDRVYRIGQKKTVHVYELWMKDSVEERVQIILKEKGLLHEEIIEHLSEKEFKRHFTLKDLEMILGIHSATSTR